MTHMADIGWKAKRRRGAVFFDAMAGAAGSRSMPGKRIQCVAGDANDAPVGQHGCAHLS